MENVYLWFKTKEYFIINRTKWKKAMKIIPTRPKKKKIGKISEIAEKLTNAVKFCIKNHLYT